MLKFKNKKFKIVCLMLTIAMIFSMNSAVFASDEIIGKIVENQKISFVVHDDNVKTLSVDGELIDIKYLGDYERIEPAKITFITYDELGNAIFTDDSKHNSISSVEAATCRPDWDWKLMTARLTNCLTSTHPKCKFDDYDVYACWSCGIGHEWWNLTATGTWVTH